MKKDLFNLIITQLGEWSCESNKFQCGSEEHTCYWHLKKKPLLTHHNLIGRIKKAHQSVRRKQK